MNPEITKIFLHGLELLNIKLNPVQIEQFSVYLQELKDWNSKINLIGPATDKEIIEKHFLDSLSVIAAFTSSGIKLSNPNLSYRNLNDVVADLGRHSLLDVGSGAGFPGIPVKIALPEISLTLLDSSKKKTEFLRHICKKLDIEAKIICDRAENAIKSSTAKYDIVVTRATAKLQKVKKLCLPFLNENGILILQVGNKMDIKNDNGGIVKKINPPDEILPGRTILTIKKKSAGFTLIELMIVVALIGILASIVIPKFAEMMRRTKEGKTKGDLGNLRSAIGLYYGDMEGMQYPQNAAAISNESGPVQTKYLSKMSSVKLGVQAHGDTNDINDFNNGDALTDLGNWGYVASSGKMFVNCTHTDVKGGVISGW
ncbi:MAG: 16S rRNA (guanine(527)-N(7))-methyltransferase RsmG [Elusimicrobia bacterium]|nr:16S rRNA (guanine(527)-N(7))-methyltransferase RsmG [Elusimicrobiota bacterium]